MKNHLNNAHLLPIDRMVGEDEEDSRLLRQMLQDAEHYLTSFKWCPPISERFFGGGVGGIIATFLFTFAVKVNGSDDRLWVIVGDCPSAYLVTDEAPDPLSALELYCDLMVDWAQAVISGSPLEPSFPVTAPATNENAEMLMSRIRFIREQLLDKAVDRPLHRMVTRRDASMIIHIGARSGKNQNPQATPPPRPPSISSE